MKKRCLAMLLTVVMAAGLLPGTAWAADADPAGGNDILAAPTEPEEPDMPIAPAGPEEPTEPEPDSNGASITTNLKDDEALRMPETTFDLRGWDSVWSDEA